MTNRTKYTSLFLILLFLSSTVWGIDLSITAPQAKFSTEFTGSTIVSTLGINFEPLVRELNTFLSGQAKEFETTINERLDKYDKQPLLARGFANSGAAMAHAGTQRSFINYKRFAFNIGAGLAGSLPGTSAKAITDAANNVKERGDIYLGAAIQPLVVGFAMNLDRWVPKLSTGFKVGYADLPSISGVSGLSFTSLSLGVFGNYQVAKSRDLLWKLFRWDGVAASSGIYYQSNKTTFEFETDPITAAEIGVAQLPSQVGTALRALEAGDTFGALTVTPTLDIAVDNRTWTIPLDINTGIRILFLGLTLGGGADLSFGTSDIILESSATLGFDNDLEDYIEITDGKVSIDASTKGKAPQIIRPRLNLGATIHIAWVKIDAPFMLYFETDGRITIVGGINLAFVL